MYSESNWDDVDSLQLQEDIPQRSDLDACPGETCKDFVLRSITELAESDLGVLHQPSNEVHHLYLVMGGVYRLEDSGVTRLR